MFTIIFEIIHTYVVFFFTLYYDVTLQHHRKSKVSDVAH